MRSAVRGFLDHSGLLIVGAVLALVWANVDPAGYARAAYGLHFIVNDIGMALFFAVAAKEVVEATAPGGALHSPRRSAVPILAAVGGMAGPACLYLILVVILHQPALGRGWAIPCATDIAFSYFVARLIFGPKHPSTPFLLLLAIADDAIGLLILAVMYPTGALRPLAFLAWLGVAIGLAWWLRRRRVQSFWPYIVGAGALSWWAFHRGGLHPALALVPIVPLLPHAARDPGWLTDSPTAHDTLNEFEHRAKLPVQIILFFFGLGNAGVQFGSVGAGTWMVLAALLIGKPIGILGATAIGTAAGLHRPDGVSWRDLTVLGIVAGIGFTVALFFATAAFAPGALLDQTKMGAVLSFGAVALALMAARLLRVGRFQ